MTNNIELFLIKAIFDILNDEKDTEVTLINIPVAQDENDKQIRFNVRVKDKELLHISNTYYNSVKFDFELDKEE